MVAQSAAQPRSALVELPLLGLEPDGGRRGGVVGTVGGKHLAAWVVADPRDGTLDLDGVRRRSQTSATQLCERDCCPASVRAVAVPHDSLRRRHPAIVGPLYRGQRLRAPAPSS